MFKSLKFIGTMCLAAAYLSGCGGSSGESGNGGSGTNNKVTPSNRVNWSGVPSEYNPKIDDIDFRIDGFEKLNINAFGFTDDAEVVYSKDVPAGTGYLRIYKVFKDRASWGRMENRANGTTLELTNYGTYQCSIRVANGQITALEGGCYVRLQVFLPVGSELEVYNAGNLITKRFIPMKTSDFLSLLDRASWAEDKFAVINTFLASYNGTNKTPSLTTEQLGFVISEFSWKEEKLKALGMLHSFVVDRENLGKMIEDKFSYFERDEARRAAGL